MVYTKKLHVSLFEINSLFLIPSCIVVYTCISFHVGFELLLCDVWGGGTILNVTMTLSAPKMAWRQLPNMTGVIGYLASPVFCIPVHNILGYYVGVH